ncbi:DUF4810 domain-containing protein [Caulobacter sp. CCNWLY153]|uniref:DUF4810 domain-containing protein n=1 Tax=unclassified Caulobacter TaxID=2648921 RepID=UPI002FF223E4
MIRKIASWGLVASAVLSLGACATPARFEWGGYEGALYTYVKKPDRRPGYRQTLETAIAKGRQTDRVAPGLLAELGYLYLEDGDTARAVPLFEEEMRRFPEARPFMTNVIERAKAMTQTAEVKS